MASVFVSHSSRDRVVTERVVERLRAAGFAALFVDFDPEQGIPAGCSWERELYAQLRRTDAVILLASEALSPPGDASLNSAWPDPWPDFRRSQAHAPFIECVVAGQRVDGGSRERNSVGTRLASLSWTDVLICAAM
jgi:hypothetical protein